MKHINDIDTINRNTYCLSDKSFESLERQAQNQGNVGKENRSVQEIYHDLNKKDTLGFSQDLDSHGGSNSIYLSLDSVSILESSGIKVKSEYVQDLSLDRITGFVESFLTPFNNDHSQAQEHDNFSKIVKNLANQDEFVIHARLTQQILDLLPNLPNLRSVKLSSALRGQQRDAFVKEALSKMPHIHDLEINNSIIEYPLILDELKSLSIRGMSSINYETIKGFNKLKDLTITHQSRIKVETYVEKYIQHGFDNLETFNAFFEYEQTHTTDSIECLGSYSLDSMHYIEEITCI